MIDDHLKTAQIILLLISPDFLASDYCYSIEMQRAIERHETGEARVIPIILQPVDWQNTPFSKLQVLPKNAKPITRWRNRADAFLEIAKGIRETVKDLTTPLTSTKDVSGSYKLAHYEAKESNEVLAHQVISNMPFQRNQYFTGRDDIFAHLKSRLTSSKIPQVISGLGGIGKTQTAIEYAYRHSVDYKYILWVRADTYDLMVSDFTSIADLLGLFLHEEQDQNLAVTAVKHWLKTHSGWLLILDNADNIEAVFDFLPKGLQGHTILTTRSHATGINLQEIEMETMKPEEAILFLLRRTKYIELDTSLDNVSMAYRIEAQKIVEVMSGLPLALAQAGAYIEKTKCGLTGYLERYKTRHEILLQEGGVLDSYYTKSVATTWSLSFEKIEEANQAAAELLRLCAFLQPDAIPEEIIVNGASELGPILKPVAADLFELDKTFEEVFRYSLVRRNPNGTITIHRLVQSVLKDNMSDETKRSYAERTVRMMNLAFPEVEFDTWFRCQLCLPHAKVCLALIEQWDLKNEKAARLLIQAGYYLRERSQYREAEAMLKNALSIYETLFGPEHIFVAKSLYHLARCFYEQGTYKYAEELYQRALEIQEKVLGIDHPDVATTINYLGLLYNSQGKIALAKSLHQRALLIREKALGLDHPDVAYSLVNIASHVFDQIEYSQSELLDSQSELLLERALTIFEKNLKPDHPDIATCLNNLGGYYNRAGKDDLAMSCYQRAFAIFEKTLGMEHRSTAACLNGIGGIYYKQENYAMAESFGRQALVIREKILGNEHPDTATSLAHLAFAFIGQGRYETAKPLLRRAIAIREKTVGIDDISLVPILSKLAALLRISKQNKEAVTLEERVKSIRTKHAQENAMDRNK